jgi:cell division protein FtsQ
MTRERIDLHGQDEFSSSAAAREDISARAIDLENDEEIQFLRTEKRVPVRRGPLAKKTTNRIKLALKISVAAAIVFSAASIVYAYGARSERFVVDSSDNIEISGVRNVSLDQVMDIARKDVVGRNVFYVSLADNRSRLESLPWVESAAVMRLLPNHIAISITERTPVAFVQIGSKISLIDGGGVLLGPPASRQTRYSFPVIHGIVETQPLASRAEVMKTYNRLISDLDEGGYTRQVSEVDLADPRDAKATVNDSGSMVVLHLGDSQFRNRFKLYATHIAEWRRENPRIESIDLRYQDQIVVNPDGLRSVDRAVSSGDRVAVKAADQSKPKQPPNSAIVRGPKKKSAHNAKGQKPRAKGQKPAARS